MPRRRIDPKIDACVRGHSGHWRKTRRGSHVCRVCAKEYHREVEHRKRLKLREKHMPLVLAYRAVPGSIKKAADLLHITRKSADDIIHGYYQAARWRVTQLKAVLELCIMTNGNGHKT